MAIQIDIQTKNEGAIKALQSELSALKAELDKVQGSTGKQIKEFSSLDKAIKENRQENRRYMFVMGEVKDAIGGVTIAMNLMSIGEQGQNESLKQLTKTVNTAYIAFQGMDAITGVFGKSLDNIGSKIGLAGGQFGLLLSVGAGLIGMYTALIDKSEQTKKTIEEQTKKLEEQKKVVSDLVDGYIKWFNIKTSVDKNTRDALQAESDLINKKLSDARNEILFIQEIIKWNRTRGESYLNIDSKKEAQGREIQSLGIKGQNDRIAELNKTIDEYTNKQNAVATALNTTTVSGTEPHSQSLVVLQNRHIALNEEMARLDPKSERYKAAGIEAANLTKQIELLQKESKVFSLKIQLGDTDIELKKSEEYLKQMSDVWASALEENNIRRMKLYERLIDKEEKNKQSIISKRQNILKELGEQEKQSLDETSNSMNNKIQLYKQTEETIRSLQLETASIYRQSLANNKIALETNANERIKLTRESALDELYTAYDTQDKLDSSNGVSQEIRNTKAQKYMASRNAIWEKYYTDEILLEKQTNKQKEQENVAYLEMTIQQAANVANTLFTISKNNSNSAIETKKAEMDAILAEMDREREAKLEIFDVELENQNLSSAQRKKLSKERAEEEKRLLNERKVLEEKLNKELAQQKAKQFFADQNAAASMAIINGALAATKAFAQMGPLGGWVGVGITAAGVAAQLAVIYAQKTPKFHTGGVIGEGNMNPNERLIVGQVGETIRTRQQEAELSNSLVNNRGIVINFNSPVSDVEMVANAIRKILTDTGKTIDKVFVNQNANIQIG